MAAPAGCPASSPRRAARGPASSLTAIGPAARTTIGVEPGRGERRPDTDIAVAPAASVPVAIDLARPDGVTAHARVGLGRRRGVRAGPGRRARRRSRRGSRSCPAAAPPTRRSATSVLRPSTASAMPACGGGVASSGRRDRPADDDAGTPWRRWRRSRSRRAGIRVWALGGEGPGRARERPSAVSGASGPEGEAEPHRHRLGRRPGVEDVDLGGAARDLLGLGDGPVRLRAPPRPAPAPSPPEAPTNPCTSDATTRPVRVVTTVLTVEIFCTSDATFSTTTWPAGSTIPW